jgi:hypothetical protein
MHVSMSFVRRLELFIESIGALKIYIIIIIIIIITFSKIKFQCEKKCQK